MWFPRLSLFSLLAILTGLGLFFAIGSFAVRGNTVALAVTVAIGSLALAGFVYALFFLAALLLATVLGMTRRPPEPTSPFATETPPPQLLPPVGGDG